MERHFHSEFPRLGDHFPASLHIDIPVFREGSDHDTVDRSGDSAEIDGFQHLGDFLFAVHEIPFPGADEDIDRDVEDIGHLHYVPFGRGQSSGFKIPAKFYPVCPRFLCRECGFR